MISYCHLFDVVSVCPWLNSQQSDTSSVALLQVLILHTNELRSLLPKGCDISTLAALKVTQIRHKHDGKCKCLLKVYYSVGF